MGVRGTCQSRAVCALRLMFAAVVLAACGQELAAPSYSSVSARDARAAAPGAVKVASAAPDTGQQNTTIDVVINGSGFEADMVATWALSGVADPNQVRTNSTRFVNSRQLVANITISGSAALAKWDIQVMSKGKGGIGTELFTVKVNGSTDTDPKAYVVFDETVNVAASGQAAVWEPALITGDYRDRTGAPVLTANSGEYQGVNCGYQTLFRRTDGALNVEVDHDYAPATMDAACGGKRFYSFYFSGRAAAPLNYGPQHYVWDLYAFAPGESRLQGVMFGIQQVGCSALHFNDAYQPSNSARVTRLPDVLTESGVARRWRVESQGSHRAMCTTFGKKGPVPTGNHFYMPFAFTFTEVLYPFSRFP